VWRAAIKLARDTYLLTETPEFKNRGSLRDQIERAAVSTSNNIAEGFERGTNKELLSFLYIARGSAGEVRSMLCLVASMPAFRNLESGNLNLQRDVEAISRQLGGWARTVRDSDKEDQKFATAKVRGKEKAGQDYKAYLEELEQIRQSG